MRKSEIYLSLFRRGVCPDVIRWCVDHDIMPPRGMRRARIEAWVLAARQITDRTDSLGRIRVRIGKLVVLDMSVQPASRQEAGTDRSAPSVGFSAGTVKIDALGLH